MIKRPSDTLFAHVPLVSFTLMLVALLIASAVYSYYDYRRMRDRECLTLIREGLAVIATFEAAARGGLTGTPKWDAQKLYSAIRDIRYRANIEFFSFITPPTAPYVFCITPETTTNFLQTTYTNIYAALEHNQFVWGITADIDNKKTLYVARPLLLDNAERIGKRTYRFYNVLLGRPSQPSFMREVRPIRDEMRALPIAVVGLPTQELAVLTQRAILHASFLGLGVFIFSATSLFLMVTRQRQRIANEALAEARANNEQLMKNLRRSDRLAILGRMAAAMAHEIRNPLGAMRGFTQIFHKNAIAQNDDKTTRYAELVLQEIDRLNASITAVLNFSKPVEPHFSPASLATLCARAVKLISRDAAAHNISLVSHVPEDMPPILLDQNLLTQALLNLLINALDAMPNGGELTLDAIDEGTSVHLMIRDTGHGIPPEHLKSIFEPFYTTKAKGTGLGLANVENIIAEHGGDIWVESILNEGTTFHIRLPYSHVHDMTYEYTSDR